MLERLHPIIMFIMRMMKTFSKTFFSFLWLHEAQPSNNPEWAKTQHPLARETAREKLSLSRLHSSCGQISRWVHVKDKVHPFYVGWRLSEPYVNNSSPVTPVTATVVYRCLITKTRVILRRWLFLASSFPSGFRRDLGSNPEPSPQRQLAGCSVLNHWGTSPDHEPYVCAGKEPSVALSLRLELH